MSLLTTLAYAIAATVRPRTPDVEIKAQIDDLKRQVQELELRISDLNRELTNTRIRHAPERHAQQTYYTQHAFQNFDRALDDYVRNCTPGRHEVFVRGVLDDFKPYKDWRTKN